MVAALAQLHEDVEQLHLGQLPHSIHNINVLQKDFCVPTERMVHCITFTLVYCDLLNTCSTLRVVCIL